MTNAKFSNSDFDFLTHLWGKPITNIADKAAIALKLAQFLKSGQVISIGSGTTSFISAYAISRQIKAKKLDCLFIPTSFEIALFCDEFGLATTSLQRHRAIDWGFDGADEIDPAGNMIKGRGGALLLEKIIMRSCREFYIVADPSKKVKVLGERMPVPVEVVPLAAPLFEAQLRSSKIVRHSLRRSLSSDGPAFTQHGNLIYDVYVMPADQNFDLLMRSIPGVVTTGLFFDFSPQFVLA